MLPIRILIAALIMHKVGSLFPVGSDANSAGSEYCSDPKRALGFEASTSIDNNAMYASDGIYDNLP
jgi:hypothetical protein